MRLHVLLEKVLDTMEKKEFNQTSKILLNPDDAEINQLVKEAGNKYDDSIRFIADAKTKNVYMFSGNWFTHSDAFRRIPEYSQYSRSNDLPPHIFTGHASHKGQDLGISGSDKYNTLYADKKELAGLSKYNWKFTVRYLSGVQDFIDKLNR
jgi:hypothetical protein